MGGRKQRKLRGGTWYYCGVKKLMGKRQVGRGTSPSGNVEECTTILYHTEQWGQDPYTYILPPAHQGSSSAILVNSRSLYHRIPC